LKGQTGRGGKGCEARRKGCYKERVFTEKRTLGATKDLKSPLTESMWKGEAARRIESEEEVVVSVLRE